MVPLLLVGHGQVTVVSCGRTSSCDLESAGLSSGLEGLSLGQTSSSLLQDKAKGQLCSDGRSRVLRKRTDRWPFHKGYGHREVLRGTLEVLAPPASGAPRYISTGPARLSATEDRAHSGAGCLNVFITWSEQLWKGERFVSSRSVPLLGQSLPEYQVQKGG